MSKDAVEESLRAEVEDHFHQELPQLTKKLKAAGTFEKAVDSRVELALEILRQNPSLPPSGVEELMAEVMFQGSEDNQEPQEDQDQG